MTEPIPDVVADPLVARLRHDAAEVTGGGVALVLGGVLVTVFVAAVIAVLLDLVVGLPGLGYRGWTLVFVLLIGGVAFAWLRQRPTLVARQSFAYVDPRAEWAGFGRFDGAAQFYGPVADALLIGPRMLEAGVRQGAGKEPASRERFFDRCALLLRQLARIGEQTKLDAVRVGDDETDDKLKPVLDYLDRTGWLGLSSDRTRLWLSGKAKTDLPRLGVPIAAPE